MYKLDLWIDYNYYDLMVNINFRLHLVMYRYELKITMDLLEIINIKVSRCPNMGLFMSAQLVGKGCKRLRLIGLCLRDLYASLCKRQDLY